MDNYLLLKLLHILAAVIVAGTGIGIAFFMFMANRSDNPQAIYITAKIVIIGDWVFTTPAIVTQVVTGLLLMKQMGYSYSAPWFYWVLGLFVLIAACWIPAIYIQYQLRDIALSSLEDDKISSEFKRLMRRWTMLGIPALVSILVIFWLMVFKPFPIR